MKTWMALGALVLAGCAVAEPTGMVQGGESEAWTPLFDGKTLDGWRPYGKPAGTPVGPGWKVEDGLLHKLPGVKGGDIVTVKTYADFELEWEWRLASSRSFPISGPRSSAPLC